MPDPTVRYATNQYTGDGSTVQRNISFAGGYLLQAHVKSYYINSLGEEVDVPLTFISENVVSTAPIVVPAGLRHVIYRETPLDSPLADFTDNAVITEANLDANARQAIFVAAELSDKVYDRVEDAGVSAEEAAASADDAANDAAAAAASAALAGGYASAADADRVQTGLDRAATEAVAATLSGIVTSGSDTLNDIIDAGTASIADDVAATAADRVQTGLDVVATTGAVGDAEDARDRAEAAAGYRVSVAYATYAALAAVTGTAGQSAAVFADAGTHTDPVVGGTVDNAGLYSYSIAPAGWQRVAGLDGSDTLVGKDLDLADNTVTGTKAQFDAACSDGNFSYAGHTHAQSDITNLVTDLAAKADAAATTTALAGKEPSLPTKTGNALKKLRINAAANAVEYVDDTSGAWTQIATSTPGSVSQVDFTSIPTTYQDLLVVFRGLSHTAGAGGTAIQTQLSANNGSSWSAAANISPALTSSVTADGAMQIPRYRGDSGAFFSALAGTGSSPDAIAATSSPGGWRITGGINALRILIATGNFDAGTITLYGR